MEEFDYGISRFVIVVGMLVFAFCVGVVFGIRHEAATRPETDAVAGFRSEEERAEYHRLLRKHGLQYDLAVIFNDSAGLYFINGKGELCPFK